MSSSVLTSGDISNRTAAFVVFPLLKRGHEDMILEKFGQVYQIPLHSSTVASFRRYDFLPLATTPLVEGVTPGGTKPTKTDLTVTLLQYGDFIPFSDVVEDTHEDLNLQNFSSLLMDQWTETIETVRYNVLKAGTNVGYANGTQRTDVNTPITLAKQRTATRALLRQRGKMLKEQISSNGNFRTEPIEAAFVGIVHVDIENDIRNMQGFIPVKQYASGVAWANEIGSVENVRYVRSVMFTPFADAGGVKGTMVSTTGTLADVYPVIYIAKDAYGIVPLKGKNAINLIVHNPGSAGGSDPLNQRGTIGWKTMQTSLILQDLWLYRLEVAATN